MSRIPAFTHFNFNPQFSFKSCKFRVQKSKEGTGRIAMWRLGIRNSYTMEATFGGSTLGQFRFSHCVFVCSFLIACLLQYLLYCQVTEEEHISVLET